MNERQGVESAPVGAAAAAALIRGRRTVARFKPQPPPAALIADAVDAARWAPNHKLTQPWRFYLLGPASIEAVVALNTEMVAATAGAEAAAAKRRRWSAIPGWLVITCLRSDDDALRAREDYAACCCAVQNLMLYLWSAGVASKWTTGAVVREPRFYRALDIDVAAEEVVALLWYGYADEHPKMRRKPTAEIFFERP